MRTSHFARSLALFTVFALSLIAIVFLFSAPVMAQATTGRLTGTVVDPNGGVVAGTTVPPAPMGASLFRNYNRASTRLALLQPPALAPKF